MLGTKKKKNGVEFMIFSENAEKIELCLFWEKDEHEIKVPMHRNEDGVWSVVVANIKEGQKYGYRAYGQYNPDQCLFFNPNKLLIDPYAKEISDTMRHWDNPDMMPESNVDTANLVPKSVVRFDRDNNEFQYLNKKPNHSLDDIIIYELNVKGFSIINPKIPEDIRGAFRGIAHQESIKYLKSLNITMVEILPIMPTCGGFHLKQEKGLSDYWGYNPYNHFAVDPKFGNIEDFKFMVNELHKNGIALCMDVVYNHTSPTSIMSYKGLDCPSYHRTIEKDGRKYLLNSTGCNNSFDTSRKPALDVFYNSIKYFSSLGVDSFRLDLAADCAMNSNHQFDVNSPFMQALRVLKEEFGVGFYGEPWNAEGIYAKDKMNNDIVEWDDRGKKIFRQLGSPNIIKELAFHMAGKEKPDANFVSVHDGFSLWDLVNYNFKNNFANNENNNDGNNTTYAWASNNKEEALTRAKTMFAMAILSRGVPIINGGDEFLRTQMGNNNAYCQDNELTWHNWKNWDKNQIEMYKFARKLLHLRKSVGLFSSAKPLTPEDVNWFRPDGRSMEQKDWDCGYSKNLSFQLKAKSKKSQDYIIIISGCLEKDVEYRLPKATNNKKWSVVFDTANKDASEITSVEEYSQKPFSMVVLTSSGESVKENMQIMPYIKKYRD